jgi:hypothetical protein
MAGTCGEFTIRFLEDGWVSDETVFGIDIDTQYQATIPFSFVRSKISNTDSHIERERIEIRNSLRMSIAFH